MSSAAAARRQLYSTCVLALLATGCHSSEAPRETFPLRIVGADLVMANAEGRVIQRGVTWDSGRPSADVCFPAELVVAKDGRSAALVVIENRQSAVVLVDAADRATPRFSSALTVPAGVRVDYAPGGQALVLISEDDTYLPPRSDFTLNRGLLYVTVADLVWHESVSVALDRARRDGRWYERGANRYVPEGPIRVSCEWTGGRCTARVESEGEEVRIVRFPK